AATAPAPAKSKPAAAAPAAPAKPTETPPTVQAAAGQEVSTKNGMTIVTQTTPIKVGSKSFTLTPVGISTGSNSAMAKAIFFIDNKQVGVMSVSPFSLMFDPYRLKNGKHQVTIRSRLSNGQTIVTKQTLIVNISRYKRIGHWLWT